MASSAGMKVVEGEGGAEEEQQLTLGVVGLSLDAGDRVKDLDQATFFRAVNDGNLASVAALLKKPKVDVNAFNDEGVTGIMLAVCNFESSKNEGMMKLLIEHGAEVNRKMAAPPTARRISIVREEHRPGVVGGSTRRVETQKIVLDHKTPLLVALELKSSLYLRGWEYRHWDTALAVLAEATLKELSSSSSCAAHENEPPVASPSPSSPLPSPSSVDEAVIVAVQRGWAAVVSSGRHQLVELWAEGQCMEVLKEIVEANSQPLKFVVEKGLRTSERIDLTEASFTIAKAIVEFLYTGRVEPPFMEQRGIDLFIAASKYKIAALVGVCEDRLKAHPDTWLKMLAAATEHNSSVLTWKVTSSISLTMRGRAASRRFERPAYASKVEPPYRPLSDQEIDANA